MAFVEYDPETGAPVRDDDGRVRKVRGGEPGLLLSKVTNLSRSTATPTPEASEKKLVRNAFRDGDVWFNTGDLMRPQGWRHAAFVDRLGDTFRWKGENVATTEVEAAVSADPAVEAVTVFGVRGARHRRARRDGGRGAARGRREFDGASLAKTVYEHLPGYAVPLFVRVVDSLEHTSTFKSKKVDLREQGYGLRRRGSAVRAERSRGRLVPYYDEYPDEVAAGSRPTG